MNYYDILEISQRASDEVIKTAYRTLVKKYHPDTFNGDKLYAEEMMKEINMAYDTLSDQVKKKKYDYSLKNSGNASNANTNSTESKNKKENDVYPDTSEEKASGCCLGKIIKFIFFIVILFGIKDTIFPSDDNTKTSTKSASISSENNNKTSSKTPATPTIDYNLEMKKYAFGSGDYLDLYLQKYNIILNKFSSKKQTIQKFNEFMSVIGSKKYNHMYMELEPNIFKNKNYKLTRDQTDTIYFGKLKDNKPNGIGLLVQTVVFNNNNYLAIKYVGNFTDGFFDGFGMMNHIPTDDELYYSPQIYGDNINNILSRLNYEEYEGEFSEGDISGSGNIFVYPTLKSELDAKGINIYSPIKGSDMQEILYADPGNISVITGKFKKGMLNGEGIWYISGSKSYEGEFKKGMLNGNGNLYFDKSKQIQYKGNFKDNKYNGKGILYDSTGNVIYKGEWNMGDYK